MPTTREHAAVATAIALGAAYRAPYVRLSHSEWENVLSLAEEHIAQLKVLEEAARAEARSHYRQAMDEFLEHVSLVIENNASKTFTEIMTRPDVLNLFGEVLAKAQLNSEGTIKGSWLAGFANGRTHAKSEAMLYGLDAVQTEILTEHPYLASVMADLEANTNAAVARYGTAAQSGFASLQLPTIESLRAQYPNLPDNVLKNLSRERINAIRANMDTVTRDLSNRVGAGSSVAVQRAYSEAQLEEYRALAKANPALVIKKLWHTNFSPTTCGWCAALHGTVLGIEATFNGAQTFAASGAGPGIYRDLDLPPRHPNCHCRVVLYIDEGAAKTLVEPADLQQAARDWANKHPRMIPRSFGTKAGPSSLGKITKFMAASDVRDMSENRFQMALTLFRQCVLGSTRP